MPASEPTPSYPLPARRCRQCGSGNAVPVAYLGEGRTRYTKYACPDCGAEFRIQPPGTTAYRIVMALLAGVFVGLLLYRNDQTMPLAAMGLVLAGYIVWQLFPAWRHPATGPAPEDAAMIGPDTDDPDPVRQQLNRIERMSPVRAALLPIAVILFVLGTAAVIGLVNDLWLEWW